MLQELRWFDAYNRNELGGAFSDQEILEMATLAPARALKLDQQLGRLARNHRADVLVIRSDVTEPRRALLEAGPSQVGMVVVGGRIRYGDADLLQGLVGQECEPLELCGASKTVCISEPGAREERGGDWTWQSIQSKLQQVHPSLAPLATCGTAPLEPFCRR